MFCNRSCASKHTRKHSAEKSKETCKKKYGSTSYFGSDFCKEHLKELHTERLGVDNPSKADSVKLKKKQKSQDKYGVDNPSQAQEVKDKIQENRTPYKSYNYMLPSGKIVKLQGYEGRGLDLLLKEYKEEEIIIGRDCPKFNYIWNGDRKYYPDFYIPSKNLIVEVKSTWTMKAQYERNLLKEKACRRAGFDFQFMVFTASELLHLPTPAQHSCVRATV